MNLLVFGKTGQVGRVLDRDPTTQSLSRADADLTDPQSCADIIAASGADGVINAAAFTDVDRAGADEDLAILINATAPAAMARAAARAHIPFVHISTDFVFEGSGARPWRVTDPCNPQNAYGRSKLRGEEGVRAAGGAAVILRTAWVFDATGPNFVSRMLELGKRQSEISVVADQISGPTPAHDIASACLSIVRQLRDTPAKAGTYHYSGGPDISRAGFARAIFLAAGLDVQVRDITTSEWPTPAQRPLNTRLECGETEARFGLFRPDWQAGIRRVLDEMKECENDGT